MQRKFSLLANVRLGNNPNYPSFTSDLVLNALPYPLHILGINSVHIRFSDFLHQVFKFSIHLVDITA